MGEIERIVEEEWLWRFRVFIQVFLHVIGEQLRREIFTAFQLCYADAFRDQIIVSINEGVPKRHPFAIAREERGVAIMGVPCVHIAEEILEAFLCRIIGRQGEAESIFADTGGIVACILEQLGNGQIGVWNGAGSVSANATMARVQSRHEHATRRGAHRAAGVVSRELHAFTRKAVNVWRGQLFLTVASGIAIAHVIHKDVDDVGLVCCTGKECNMGK